MHDLGPAVLVHIVAEIMVFRLLLFFKPVIEIALDAVGGDGEAAALFENAW